MLCCLFFRFLRARIVSDVRSRNGDARSTDPGDPSSYSSHLRRRSNVSIAINASETRKRHEQGTEEVGRVSSIRKIIGVAWKDKLTKAEILTRTEQKRLTRYCSREETLPGWHQNAQPVVQWTGYQLMVAEEETVKEDLAVDISQDLQASGVSWNEVDVRGERPTVLAGTYCPSCSSRYWRTNKVLRAKQLVQNFWA